jgi:Uma2 family endonuclease
VSTQPTTFLTPEQYLEIERKAEYKSEYLNGEMFAMAGAGEQHNRITVNLLIELGSQFRGGKCRSYGSDMRVHVPASGLYTYPDISVVCGPPKLADQQLDNLLNPILIVEVLSPSTEAYDRGRKFEYYRSIETLNEYLLVAQERPHVELYTKEDGRWLLSEARGLEQNIELKSVGCRVPLSAIYELVEF